ncbi:MAG: DNA-directed polymerase subunit, partial [Euryarchaeota archaeon]|nr:DNA-directed polymerase subunit [Euryarchaeota archaeon]
VQIPPSPFGVSWPVCCSFSNKVVRVTKFAVKDHEMVPEHVLLTPEESAEVLKAYNIEAPQLPKIHITDPAAKEIEAKVGDIIKVIRKSTTAKQSIFYRLVID